MGGVVRYTEQMALTGDTLAKNEPLGCALQRAGPRQEGWGWGYIRTDSPSVNRRQSYLCQPLLLQRSQRWGRDKRRRAQVSSGMVVKIVKILMGKLNLFGQNKMTQD